MGGAVLVNFGDIFTIKSITWYTDRGRGGKFEHLPGQSGRVCQPVKPRHTNIKYITVNVFFPVREWQLNELSGPNLILRG